MGLDMHLYRIKKKDIHEGDTIGEALNRQYDKKAKEHGIDEHKAPDFLTRYRAFKADTSFNVMYWRKANAVHKFFVDHAQEGVDDCEAYEVDMSVINLLLEQIDERILLELKGKGDTSDVLPTAEGFFFGDVGYHQSYFRDLERTRDAINDCLPTFDPGIDTFIYRASW